MLTYSQWRPYRPARQLTQLYAGLVLYGVSMALMVRSQLGLNPWGVLHEGLALRTGWTFGLVSIVVAAAVLLLWIPLRQRPGIGTVSNVIVIGVAVDATLTLLSTPSGLATRAALLVTGIVLNGLASACYIGAGLGPGPRDGLMTGWVHHYGGSLRVIRTGLEVAVLSIGWLLGGTVGLGTVLYAVGIGSLVQLFLPSVTVAAVEQSTR